MSYSSYGGYNGNYVPPPRTQANVYGTARPTSTNTTSPVTSTYQPSNSLPAYRNTSYGWQDRNQPGSEATHGTLPNYGSTAWRDQQNRSSELLYDYQRSPNNYSTSPTPGQSLNGWYGATSQPETPTSTQALSSLAYASSLNAPGQQVDGDQRATWSQTGSQQYESAQREGNGHERTVPHSQNQMYPSIQTRTTQPEQSSLTSHQNVTMAAAALAGTSQRRYSNSPQQVLAHTNQRRGAVSPVVNARISSPANVVPSTNHQQQQAPSVDTNSWGHSRTQTQVPSHSHPRAQLGQETTRHESAQPHRPSQLSNPSATLPLPATSGSTQEKAPYVASSHRSNEIPLYRPSETPGGIKWDTAPKSDMVNAPGLPRLPGHQPDTSMPTFIDPSQVFNPYHKEHERQEREKTERVKRASIEATKSTPTSQHQGQVPKSAKKAASTSKTKQQASRAANTEAAVRSPSQSSFTSAERKDSGSGDMANDMKVMVQQMREWKTKDPALFQKLWDDMKKSSGGSQSAEGQTSTKSPQLPQIEPQQSAGSQHHNPNQPASATASQSVSAKHGQDPRPEPQPAGQRQNGRNSTAVVNKGTQDFPDLGRFPAARRNRGGSKLATGKAMARSATSSAQNVPSTPSHPTGQLKQAEGPAGPNTQVPHAIQAPGAVSMAVPVQPINPASPNIGISLPLEKQRALAEAMHRGLLGLPENKGKEVTASQIHDLLQQNRSYIGLCQRLENLGLVLHRANFARYLLKQCPDLVSSPHKGATPSQQPAHTNSAAAQPPQRATNHGLTDPTFPPSCPIDHHRPMTLPSPLSASNVPAATPAKATNKRPVKAGVGVPSPSIPTPVPGSKEANARKRNFSELVDLTRLSDDEDYAAPTKQIRRGVSLLGEQGSQAKSDPSSFRPLPFTIDARPDSGGFTSNGSTHEQLVGPRNNALSLSGPGTWPVASQAQAPITFQPVVSTTPQKSSHLLAKPLNKAEALRKSYYDPKTVARDILIAAGRHPGEHSLNSHLAGLLGKHIDQDSDLGTFDWDSVDPGGPPILEVPIVSIPANPPRWGLGQRRSQSTPNGGTSEPHKKAREPPSKRVTNSGSGHTRRPVFDPALVAGQARLPNGHASLGRLSSQARSLLNELPNPAIPASRLRESQNANETELEPVKVKKSDAKLNAELKTNLNAGAAKPNTPDTPHQSRSRAEFASSSRASIKSSSPDPLSLQRNAFKHSAFSQPRELPTHRPFPINMNQSTEQPVKRRGRPPGAKNKHPRQIIPTNQPRKGVRLSDPGPSKTGSSRRSTSPSYSIYGCRWDQCEAQLHNLSTLQKHIAKVHQLSESEIKGHGQPCLWKNCRTLENKDDNLLPVVTFNSPSNWLDHIQSDHLHPLGMKLGDGPSSAQTGKPKYFEVSRFYYRSPAPRPVPKARTCSHTDPQTLSRDRLLYLSDRDGRTVIEPSTETSILNYPSDTLILSAATMDTDLNTPNRAFSKSHGNEKMDLKQSAIETLLALQRHKEKVGPGLDRGGCTLVNDERRTTLMDSEGMARVVDGDY